MTYKEAFYQTVAMMANTVLITTMVYQTWKLNRWMSGDGD